MGNSSDASAAIVIEYDLPCRTCGYNLRGLAVSARCPECDTAVARSLHGQRLCYSDPRWVRTMARGMRLISVTGLLALAYVAARYLVPLMVNASETTLGKALAVAAPAIVLIIGGMGIAGLCMVTSRDPALGIASGRFRRDACCAAS
jgi:hypothetical protein